MYLYCPPINLYFGFSSFDVIVLGCPKEPHGWTKEVAVIMTLHVNVLKTVLATTQYTIINATVMQHPLYKIGYKIL